MGLLSDLRYDNARDVQLRLQSSVVLYRGRPVFVGQNIKTPQNGDADLILDVLDLLATKWERVHSSDEELDVRSQRLGYMNYDGCGWYVVRMPCRRQRQGLTCENTFVYKTDSPVQLEGLGSRKADNPFPITVDMLKSKAFGQMIMQDYPDINSCLEHLTSKKKLMSGRRLSMAFGRKLLVTLDEIGLVKLHFSTTPIGYYNRKTEGFVLPEQFEHYERLLKAHDVPITRIED